MYKSDKPYRHCYTQRQHRADRDVSPYRSG
nr:MAG TPA: hypothetical protein [Caudoviricetes sp.]